ncbi:hypothetical protein [Leuconostoc mesenteroides]|uniref:hypothetical protein n=1 Tax=Leuconostoc mesenteroides TaxID=1245 RepID=UPI00068ECA5E|nr:hypothetical protein [Leuconostoc mesenteroides]
MNEKKPERLKVLSIIAIVIGIIALISSWMPFVNNGSFAIAIVSLVMGIIGMLMNLKNKKLLSLVAIVISSISIAVVIVTQSSYSSALENASKESDKAVKKSENKTNGNNTDKYLKNMDINIGQLQTNDDGYGNIDTKMEVSIKNTSSKKINYSVTVQAYSSNTEKLGDPEYIEVELQPDESIQKTIFEYLPQDKVQSYKDATYKISKVQDYSY